MLRQGAEAARYYAALFLVSVSPFFLEGVGGIHLRLLARLAESGDPLEGALAGELEELVCLGLGQAQLVSERLVLL